MGSNKIYKTKRIQLLFTTTGKLRLKVNQGKFICVSDEMKHGTMSLTYFFFGPYTHAFIINQQKNIKWASTSGCLHRLDVLARCKTCPFFRSVLQTVTGLRVHAQPRDNWVRNKARDSDPFCPACRLALQHYKTLTFGSRPRHRTINTNVSAWWRETSKAVRRWPSGGETNQSIRDSFNENVGTVQNILPWRTFIRPINLF